MMIPKQKLLPSPSPEPQAGFTIIECLLAIIIVAVLMVAIAPAIALSVATRVQARRVELATQAARTYVDGVQKSGTIETPNNVVLVDLTPPQAGGVAPNNPRLTFSNAATPPSTLNCPIPPNIPAGTPLPAGYYCQNPVLADQTNPSLYCINLDGKGCVSTNRPARNFVVQAFRSITPDPNVPTQPNASDDGTAGYLLGVRVYRIDAFDGGSALTKTATPIGSDAKRQLAYTAGVGDRKAPLVEFTTEIRGNATDWQSLCDRLGGCTAPAANPNPNPAPAP